MFKQGFGASRVKLHLNWGGAFPGTALLERIVIESSRLAALLGQEIAFELTLAAREVTPVRAASSSTVASRWRMPVRLAHSQRSRRRPRSSTQWTVSRPFRASCSRRTGVSASHASPRAAADRRRSRAYGAG